MSLSWQEKTGFIPLTVLLAVIALVLLFNIQEPIFDPPYLQFVFQAIFVFATGIVIAIISARAYLASGSINILLLGSALFVSSLSSTISSWAVNLSANEAATIGNTGILISSIIILLAAITTLSGTTYGFSNRKMSLSLIYALCLALVAAIGLMAAFDLLPDFLTPTGPTSLRLIVLTVSILLYLESALMFGVRFLRFKSYVVYWYSLALAMFSLALVAAVLTQHLGDITNWVSRLALYLSGIYFLIALLSRKAKEEISPGFSSNWANAFRLDGRQSETLFANMLNGFMYCKIETDANGQPTNWIYLDVNKAYEQIMRLKKEQVLGKEETDFYPQEPKELFIERYGRVALSGKPVRFEVYRNAIGKWLNVSAYSPKKGYFISIFEDISERKRAEEELAIAASFPSINPSPIIEVDFMGHITYTNPSTKENFPNLELLGTAHPFLADWQKIVQIFAGRPSASYNREIKVGEKWFLQSLFLVPKTKLIRIYSMDITERKEAGEALKESEELFSTAFHSLSFPVSLVRLSDNQFIDVNEAFLELLGRSKEEVVGHTSEEINMFPKYKDREDFVNLLQKEGSVKNQEINIQTKPGSVKRVLFSVELIKIGGQPHMLSSLIDITERRRLEKEIQTYTKELELLVEQRTKQLKDAERLAAIGATAGMVGHDIRNPLQAIISDVFLAKTELDSILDNQAKKNLLESLHEIEINTDYINKIVQDLQDYARPLNPKLEISDIEAITRDVIKKNKLPKDITASIKVNDQAKKVYTDAYYLNRILYNLIINAIQAMPTGGKLTIEAIAQDNEIVLKVKDTGVGIPKEIQPKLFTVMFTTKSKGQGFGLPVVKRMTESLGGTVSFETQEGKGTTFTIRLPLGKS